MIEFGIINNKTKESNVIFGYNPIDAFRRAKLNATDWTIDWADYID